MLISRVDVCVVYAVVAIATGVDWISRGRKSFRGVGERKGDVGAITHTIVDVPGGGKL